jgi:polysaccharide pyruvyl transferase WcaK-like protein
MLYDQQLGHLAVEDKVGQKGSQLKDCETKRKKIAFFGHFDSSNFGNESTLQAILCNLRRFQPDAEIMCICTGPEATVRMHQIEAIPIAEQFVKAGFPRNRLLRIIRRVLVGIPSELYRWIKALMRLNNTNMLIIPGTGLLTDAYGLTRWGPYSMFKWCLIAKVCRCKLLFVSVGAGPIYGGLGRWLAKSALSLADFRTYRDDSSKQYLKDIGFRADNDQVYPDLVFSLPEAAIPYTGRSGRPVVGLGLMGYAGKYSVPKPSSEIYLAYLDNLVCVVSWLLTREYDVRLLIGDLGDVHVTQEFRRLLRERLSGLDERRIIDDPVFSVEELLSQIATTDIVVATRFHNVLLGLLCNKPVVSISFHHKCESLMSTMGLSAYCLDINSLKADRLIEKICEIETNACKLKPVIREKVKEFRRALDEQYDFIFSEI